MAKPVRHYDKWRIRWRDEYGERQSRVFDSKEDAALALKQAELHVQEIKFGITPKLAAKKTFTDLSEYWTANKLPFKRSAKDDISILKTHLMPAFSHLLLKDLTPQLIDALSLEKPISISKRYTIFLLS